MGHGTLRRPSSQTGWLDDMEDSLTKWQDWLHCLTQSGYSLMLSSFLSAFIFRESTPNPVPPHALLIEASYILVILIAYTSSA